MFRFRFQALLAIRRREELVRQGVLARALVREREAGARRTALLDEVERTRRDLAEALRPATSGGGSTALVALLAYLRELEARAARAEADCERADRERTLAASSLEESARPRRALERLEATERARYDLACARADEAEFGDANARRVAPPAASGAARG